LLVRSDLAALGAVVMWASLATLATTLDHIPPLLLTGLGLLIGSLIALPLSGFRIKRIWPEPKVLLLGVYGLFGYHVALFAGLQNAPAVQANLVNYLWPLLIVGQFETAAVGAFGLVAGSLAIAAHFLFEEPVAIAPIDILPLVLLGLGALGASFYLWAYALQNGQPQRIGLIAFLTPLLSTAMLVLTTGSVLSPLLLVSAALIFGAAWLGGRSDN